MNIWLDEIEGNFYCDIILSENDIDKLNFGALILRETRFQGKKLYIGIYENRIAKHEKKDTEGKEENSEDYGRI
jgi:hypothetical protein